ncbi:hypothetical protein CAPTEDRAFT_197263 [Capitella teleta]|uniref:Sushi domain-containing protein n=1 Tax=Capitella teleta TaxID=283909 RepID=R7U242_CAPTE|nr:hypothetical protein CAPTEDRAFT_197263 [Capitella teleta]|eukprot:ELU00060.1 hypothetical protein CAPTEDRAFT_197263 [Capitella teleta]
MLDECQIFANDFDVIFNAEKTQLLLYKPESAFRGALKTQEPQTETSSALFTEPNAPLSSEDITINYANETDAQTTSKYNTIGDRPSSAITAERTTAKNDLHNMTSGLSKTVPADSTYTQSSELRFKSDEGITTELYSTQFSSAVDENKATGDVDYAPELGATAPSVHTTSRPEKISPTFEWIMPPGGKAKFCPTPPDVKNAFKETDGLHPSSVVTYTCHVGYEFKVGGTSRTTICTCDYKWTVSEIEDCQARICADPPKSPKMASHIADASAVGSKVKFECKEPNEQFESGVASMSAQCSATGRWNTAPTQCTEGCGAPPFLENAILTEVNTSHGQIAEYECQRGFLFSSGLRRLRITCRSEGKWDPDTPGNCLDLRCPPVPEISNANPNTRLSLLQTTVNYTCYDGFKFPHGLRHKTARCNGHAWNVESSGDGCNCRIVESCTLIDFHFVIFSVLHCPKLDLSSIQHVNTSETAYGTYVEMMCKPGFLLDEEEQITVVHCTSSGLWSSQNQCKAIVCPDIIQVDGKIVDSLNVHPGAEVNISCHESAILSTKRSHMIVRCLENGKWNQGIPDCIEKSRSKTVIEPVEASGSDLIGVVAGLLVGFLLLFIFAIDAPAIARDCKTLRENIGGRHN